MEPAPTARQGAAGQCRKARPLPGYLVTGTPNPEWNR